MPGVDPLAELRDIHLPTVQGWWPPAPGWWIMAILLLLTLAWLGLMAYRSWHRKRPVRAAVRLLDELKRKLDAGMKHQQVAAEVSTLLRRFVLSREDCRNRAGLHGEQWLQMLDDLSGGNHFTSAGGRSLLHAPYQPDADIDAHSLIEAARRVVTGKRRTK